MAQPDLRAEVQENEYRALLDSFARRGWVYLDMERIAEAKGVKVDTIRVYRSGTRRSGTPLPPEDEMFGQTPVWRPETVARWLVYDRPGQGAGGGAGKHRKHETGAPEGAQGE